MTRSAAIALAVSLAVHALLAVAVVGLSSLASAPETLAELDLSSVELSFSEEEAPAPPMPPAASAPSAPAPPPPPAERPPEPEPPERILPPDPEAVRLREPEEPVAEMKPPPRPPEERKEPPKPAAAASAPSRPAPRQAHVDAPPRPKRAIRPQYPQGARQRGEEGRVVLEIEVGADGTCTAVRVVASCGFAELDAAAVKAARAARFTPARSGGAPVASTARLALDFRLR
ncbi:MAG: energy transducer TonB [Kiritimatiellia bacterium]